MQNFASISHNYHFQWPCKQGDKRSLVRSLITWWWAKILNCRATAVAQSVLDHGISVMFQYADESDGGFSTRSISRPPVIYRFAQTCYRLLRERLSPPSSI
ncbi:hypothetical protein K503DRAFT_372057 [Rhizopogon vinicolor AM-OR11-026]|uniref:Uncharacterized protein n=1 Tax=Rhizopogon vinicolor AM-OR11-026 TaxID=1314800 RepID=A0A1B7MRX7_9AGAM|nr:hypothetical protein K503DRAFT_372057 [Rhizopogon vinicolor AM-OR11-026]